MKDEPEITKEDREEAIRFYFNTLTNAQSEWVESGEPDEDIDSDVVSLAKAFSEVRHAAETRGFLAGLAAVVKRSEKATQ